MLMKNTLVGISKANEALIFGKKMEADELLACGFVKCVFIIILRTFQKYDFESNSPRPL